MFTEQPIRVARHRRLPWLTLLLSALAAGLVLCGIGTEGLEFDRTAISAGQIWRLATGHFTHWNADHMAWDVMMFAVLGAMIERHNRWSYGCLLALFYRRHFRRTMGRAAPRSRLPWPERNRLRAVYLRRHYPARRGSRQWATDDRRGAHCIDRGF